MRKLFASLLLLSFLAGANARTAAPGSHAAAGIETASAVAPSAAQPSLPGHLTAAGPAAAAPLLESGAVDAWRTLPRTQRSHTDAPAARAAAAAVRLRIARLQRSRREFGQTLARARRNVPATFGNPPPSSPI